MRGKLIVIEGTDCSGKETQTKMLVKKLKEKDIIVDNFSFPNYESATGKIIGGPYLGKSYIGDSYFQEGAASVDPKVASLYYAADRRYNIKEIIDKLMNGVNVILDRYVYSNMAHQAGKLNENSKRNEMYEWLEKLEFDLCELPKADIKILLHMPTEAAKILKKNRVELPDGHERDENHLLMAEAAYAEIALKYEFKVIECFNGEIRSIEDINEELFNYIIKALK